MRPSDAARSPSPGTSSLRLPRPCELRQQQHPEDPSPHQSRAWKCRVSLSSGGGTKNRDKKRAEMEKKAKACAPQLKTCASCGAVEEEEEALKVCTRCRITYYCNATCQRQHWKNGHKQNCVPPEQRTAAAAAKLEAAASLGQADDIAAAVTNERAVDEGALDECAICLEALAGEPSTLSRLPCSHSFHTTCINQWRQTGAASCPACRRTLPRRPSA